MRKGRTIATRQRSRRRYALWSTARGIFGVCARSGTQRPLPWRLPGWSGDAPLSRHLVSRSAQAELDAALAGLRSGLDSALRTDGVLGGAGCTSSDPGRRRALALWWLQLGLNAAWTPVFFGARRIGAGAVVICALLPAVAATAAASARVDRPAGLLYSPYLAWSTYAAALNLEICRLNRSPALPPELPDRT
jgi:hypothetical protein